MRKAGWVLLLSVTISPLMKWPTVRKVSVCIFSPKFLWFLLDVIGFDFTAATLMAGHCGPQRAVQRQHFFLIGHARIVAWRT